MKRLSYDELLAEFRTLADWEYAPWGAAMHWFFDTAEELHYRDNFTAERHATIPAAWGFRPSPLHSRREFTLPARKDREWAVTHASTPALLRFGNLMNRYADLLRAAGRDY